MSQSSQQLQRNIMRRVYYVYGLRLATHPVTLHAIILVAAMYILSALVNVGMVWRNIADTRVGDLGYKLFMIVFQADTITLAVLGLAIFTAFSLRFQMRWPRPLQPIEHA